MESSIWAQTYRSDELPGVPGVDVTSAIHDEPGSPRTLVAHLAIRHHGCGTKTDTRRDLTPRQMRDLATLLDTHAARIESQLLPLLHKPVDLIDFTLNPAPVPV